MSLSRTRLQPSLLSPIALLLPLTLLATVLLPGVGIGSGVLGATPAPGSGGAPVETPHAGTGLTPSDGAYATVTVAPPSALLVAGGSEILTSQVTASSPGAVVEVTSYLWSVSSGAPGDLGPLDQPSSTFYAATVTAPTQALVTVQVRGFVLPSWDGEFFSVSATASLTIVPPLTASPVTATPDPAAPGEPVTLSTTVAGGASPYTIAFQLGDGAQATLTQNATGPVSISHVYAAGVFAPSAVISDASGSQVPTSSQSSVVVTAHLGAAIEAPVGADQGTAVVVRSSVGGGAAPYSYLWSDSWGDSSFSAGGWTLVPDQVGPLTLHLTVSDAQGQVAVAPPVTITVSSPPTVSLSSRSPEADVGSAFPLLLTVGGGTGPFQVSWDPGQGSPTLYAEFPTDGVYSEPYAFDRPGTITATAQLQDALGVGFGTSSPVGRIVPDPSIALDATPGVPTEGQPFSLTAVVGDGAPPYDWSWSFDGPVLSSTPLAGTLSGPGSVLWNGTLPAAEDLVAQLQVVDASGGVANASLALEVVAPLQVSVSVQPSRGEVGRPLTAQVTLLGGSSPYGLALTASDGETVSSSLGSPGTQALTLLPQTTGNLTISVRASDALGHTYLAGAVVPISPAFDALLALNQSAVDAGGRATTTLLLQGGWGPFQGDVTLSDGRVYPLDTTSTSVVLNLVFPAAGAVTLTAQVTDALGAVSGRAQTMQIDPDPWAALSVASAQTDAGAPLAFLATAGGGSGTFPFLWVDYGDGNGSSSWSSTHVYTRPGHYLANGSVADTLGGHAASSPVDVLVVPAPEAAAELLVPGTDAGLAAAFSSQVSFGTPPFSYQWSFGDGAVSALADPSHIFARAGLYQVVLTVTDGSGTVSVAPTVNVTVSSPALLSAAANRTSLEVGVPGGFQATVLGGAAPAQVTWSFGDGSVSTGLALSHTYTAAGTYTVVASLYDAAGGTAVMSLTVDVAPALAATGVSILPEISEVGERTVLSETPVGGLGPYQLTWRLSGAVASGVGMTRWTFVPNASGPLSGSVSTLDAAGVTTVVAFAFTVAPPLQAGPLMTPNVAEAGHPFQMQSGASGGVPPYTFQWSLPPPLVDPGNRSAWAAALPTPGTYVVGIVVTDALGRSVESSISVVVDPALEVEMAAGGLVADAGVPFQLGLTILGGVGAVHAEVVTPWGPFPLGAGALLFPTPGEFPVEVEATDQTGAVALGRTNLTVSPPPVVDFTLDPTKVAVGAPVTWSAAVLGGEAPYVVGWQVAGVGAWEGPAANFTFPSPGTYEVTVTVQDAAGGRAVLRTNTTAVLDDLALSVNLTRTEGLVPLDTFLVTSVSGSASRATTEVYVDGEAQGPSRTLAAGLPWTLPLQLDAGGDHTLEVDAQDALGATARAVFTVAAFTGLGPLHVLQDPATSEAGVPLSLSASSAPSNGTWVPGEAVGLRWWGPGIVPEGDGTATFLDDRSGTATVELSGTVSAPDGSVLQNQTIPVPIEVTPGEATQLSIDRGTSPCLVGTNDTVLLAAEDPFGNLNATYTGNVTARQVSGPSAGPAEVPGDFFAGEAALAFASTKAGVRSYVLENALAEGTPLRLSWQADASRGVLRLLSWERLGSSLLLNVSALDVYGNPLDNVTVTAEVPGGSAVSGVVTDGNVSLLLPGASGVTNVELLGPGGAQTDVALPSGGDPPADGTDLLLAAMGLGGLLAGGALLSWQRRRARARRSPPRSDSPTLSEAKGAMEEIIEHLPGEDRATLLVLAEEHGIPRKDAEEALVLLEKDHRATRRTDNEGVERWDPPVPMEDGPDDPRSEARPPGEELPEGVRP